MRKSDHQKATSSKNSATIRTVMKDVESQDTILNHKPKNDQALVEINKVSLGTSLNIDESL